ncbi:MAG: hypothetical protein AMJ62_16390 [Myxococcales bacterium SG8_38]|nr:MAG: hypothetical protein AMJ62_16390 [Myxococcales bacterium SG8_38]
MTSPAATDILGERLASLTNRQELFARRQYEPVISQQALAATTSAWFGVGIAADQASCGLPVDVLILMFAQEMVRRELGLNRSFILIADSNACNAGVPRLDVHRSASLAQAPLEALIDRFRFPVDIRRSSSLAPASEVERKQEALDIDNGYVAQQLVQTEIMRKRGAGVKVGWALSACTYDETYFDRLYRNRFGDLVTFVYTIGGRTLNAQRPRACPYLCREPRDRLLLGTKENAVRKLYSDAVSPAVRGYRRLIAKLARAYQHLTGEDPGTPESFLQFVVDASSGTSTAGTRRVVESQAGAPTSFAP